MPEIDDGSVPTDTDVAAALRLARKYLYGGKEPYGPAIYTIASMLAEYRDESCRELIALNQEKDALLLKSGQAADEIELQLKVGILTRQLQLCRGIVDTDPYYRLCHELRHALGLPA